MYIYYTYIHLYECTYICVFDSPILVNVSNVMCTNIEKMYVRGGGRAGG